MLKRFTNLVSQAENSEETKVQFGGLIEKDNLRTEAGLNLMIENLGMI